MSDLNTVPALETSSVRWEREAGEFAAATKALARELAQNAAPFIGVFGSARDSDKAPWLHWLYGDVFAKALGKLLARRQVSMLSGGCPGMVDLAQEAFCNNRRDAAAQKSVGIRITCLGFHEPANPHLDETLHAPDFGSRLELMLQLCAAFVVLGGGIGSLLEVAYFLQHVQAVNGHRDKPIILVGRMWYPVTWLLRVMAWLGTVDRADIDRIQVASSLKRVEQVIDKVLSD